MFYKTKDCSLETDSGLSLPRSTPTEFTEHEEVELVTTWSLHHYILVSLVKEGPLQATKRNASTNQVKNLHLQSVLPVKYASAVVAQN